MELTKTIAKRVGLLQYIFQSGSIYSAPLLLSTVQLGDSPRKRQKANANDVRLSKMLKLSEWGCEYSVDEL